MKISIVIPVYNEEPNLEELINRCLKACETIGKPFEIILIDDGSNDNSVEIIKKYSQQNQGKIIGIILNRNYGQHAAIMAGFTEIKGDIVVTLDADLQNPPEEIPNLVKKIEEGFDVVGSVRKNRQDTFFRRFASYVVNKSVQKNTGINMNDYGCMLRAYKRHIVDAMLSCKEHSTFIPILANSFARRTCEIEVSHEKRIKGESKYNLWKLINLNFDLLASMNTFPLRVLSILGFFIAAAGTILSIFLLLMRIILGPEWAVHGVFTLFAVLFIFIGAQFIGIGVLGEYIGRIYHDVRDRPMYFIERIVGRD